MASTISVRGEPGLVNLVVRALGRNCLLLDIFLHLRSETWTQWMIEAARVKVHHRPISFEDGPVVYPANAFDSRLRGDWVPLGSSPTKSLKSAFRISVIAFLYNNDLQMTLWVTQRCFYSFKRFDNQRLRQ